MFTIHGVCIFSIAHATQHTGDDKLIKVAKSRRKKVSFDPRSRGIMLCIDKSCLITGNVILIDVTRAVPSLNKFVQ